MTAVNYRHWADQLFRQKNFEEALEDYSCAIKLDPENAHLYWYRAMTFKALGRRDEGLADYVRAIELDMNYAFATFD